MTSAKGSAWAEKVASGVQYAEQPLQPCPVSQASKNASAIEVISARLLILSMAEVGPYQLVFDRFGGSGDTSPSESNGNPHVRGPAPSPCPRTPAPGR